MTESHVVPSRIAIEFKMSICKSKSSDKCYAVHACMSNDAYTPFAPKMFCNLLFVYVTCVCFCITVFGFCMQGFTENQCLR